MKVGQAIDLLLIDFLERGSSQTTWRTDYLKVLKHLDRNVELTTELLVDLVQQRTGRNTKSRVRYLMVASQLAKIGEIPWNPKSLKPQRGKRKLKPRNLPDDREIFEFWRSVNETRPDWAWVIGMMATFGLRNHEVFFAEFSPHTPGAVEVTEGKTGERVAFGLYPEWIDRFDLRNPKIPPIRLDRPHDSIGHSVTEFFSRVHAPCNPYDLRHAWAVRAHLLFRLSDVVAANCMGHSVEVHRGIYLKWITMAQTQREIEAATGITQQTRPLPPL